MPASPLEPPLQTSKTSIEIAFEVLLFGALKDAARADRIEVYAPSTLAVSTLLETIAAQFPSLKKYLPHVRVAVNCEYSSQNQNVKSGDEIALLPPVAGGCIGLLCSD